MNPLATYDYCDEQGNLLFVVERQADKSFRQRRPDGDGWLWNLNGTRRVPYRVNRVIAAMEAGQPVYVVEGEKDVHALEAIGLTATCNPGGAGKWDATWCIYFADVPAYILPDNDPPGRAHALQVAESLLWTAKSVKVVELPGLEDKGDVSDWITAGGELPGLEEIVASAPEFTIADAEWQTTWSPDTTEGHDAPPELLTRTDGQPLLYPGKLHWFQGEPESGKTFAALAAVAEALNAGRTVLFVDFEDSRTSVVGRLEAMSADTSRLVYIRPTEPLEDKGFEDVNRLMELAPTVVVLDGVAEAMAIHGLDPIRAMDTATFVHEILDRFRDPSVTTIVIDHVARGDAGKGRYAYGSQHKLASVDGAAYRFEVVQPFSREQGGAARIDVAKDRPGFVRSFALDKQHAGVLRVVPGLEVFIEPPTIAHDDDSELSYTQRRVLDVLEPEGHGLSDTEIGNRLASDGKGKPLKRNTIKDALDELIGKELADGSRSSGREASLFWRTEPPRERTPG
ncbi:hypothetical protein BH18ACT15_BH18ACT15_11890 [soil metagenome]